ncbi:hypothetical protein ACQV19_19170, partial [Pantoea allii]|uniref:hypothetical protein n=1 Tax=Pantoea allii TaxID=574096 RepID=UPI003D318A3E
LIRLSAYPLIRLSAYPLIRLSAYPLIRLNIDSLLIHQEKGAYDFNARAQTLWNDFHCLRHRIHVY